MSSTLSSLSAPPTGFSGRIVAWAGIVGRTARHVFRAMRHRSEVTQLLDLDDRSLKDIGLLRSDVLGALAASYREDPSVWLRLRAVEQRASARARTARLRERRTSREIA